MRVVVISKSSSHFWISCYSAVVTRNNVLVEIMQDVGLNGQVMAIFRLEV